MTISSAKTLLLAALAAAVYTASSAQAAVVITYSESGSDVVATGSGSLDTTALSGFVAFGNIPRVDPDDVHISIGSGSFQRRSAASITGPPNIGFGTLAVNATSSTGNPMGIWTSLNRILMPSGYVSGAPLSGTSTWAGQSFASLGLTPGTYVYTYTGSNGPATDTFTVNVGAPVPEPASAAFLGLGALGLLRRRRK